MILSIDPGSEKTGIAVVKKDGNLVMKKIIKTECLEEEIKTLTKKFEITETAIGNGTHHKKLEKRIEKLYEEMKKEIPISIVDEKYTTEIGEQWYKKANPPKGWKRIIPFGMRTVDKPVDDYVAWVIACIHLGKIEAEYVGHKKI